METHQSQQQAGDEDVERAPFGRQVQRPERVHFLLVRRLELGRHEHHAAGRQGERGNLRRVVDKVPVELEGGRVRGGGVGEGRRDCESWRSRNDAMPGPSRPRRRLESMEGSDMGILYRILIEHASVYICGAANFTTKTRIERSGFASNRQDVGETCRGHGS